MNVVDSSAWLEYFAGGPNAAFFAAAIEDPDHQVVPTVTVVEVFKRIVQQRDEAAGFAAVGLMQQGHVADLTASLALAAAALSVGETLPLADSVVLATARAHDATPWTQDADFEHLSGVRCRARR